MAPCRGGARHARGRWPRWKALACMPEVSSSRFPAPARVRKRPGKTRGKQRGQRRSRGQRWDGSPDRGGRAVCASEPGAVPKLVTADEVYMTTSSGDGQNLSAADAVKPSRSHPGLQRRSSTPWKSSGSEPPNPEQSMSDFDFFAEPMRCLRCLPVYASGFYSAANEAQRSPAARELLIGDA